jgi:NADH-quinone oxidoreductase subunit C
MEENVRGFLKERFDDAIIGEDNFRGEQVFQIKPESLIDICQALLEDVELDVRYLSDITVVDWLGHERERDGRFEVVYNLYSLSSRHRFFLSIRLESDRPTLRSLTDLWPSANWLEREAYDLFGIEFAGHPDLTKILTPEDLEGHPLRKDFPLTWEQPTFGWNKDTPPEVIR